MVSFIINIMAVEITIITLDLLKTSTTMLVLFEQYPIQFFLKIISIKARRKYEKLCFFFL